MKYLYLLHGFYAVLVVAFTATSCQAPAEVVDPIQQAADLEQQLIGEYDNFLQAWQERTDTDQHRVKTSDKHQRIHTSIRALEEGLSVKHYVNGDSTQIVGEGRWKIFNTSNGLQFSRIDQANTSGQQLPIVLTDNGWQAEGEGYFLAMQGDTLVQATPSGSFAQEEGVPYRSIRCRYFSGWIQYPVPGFEDSTYFMGPLKLHDQGDKVQLILDKEPIDYTVELTQLVFGKRIPIMKLAVYEMPADSVSWNSYAVSYTWSSPEAKRIGINLRKVLSGWTLIEPDYVNSNTMRK